MLKQSQIWSEVQYPVKELKTLKWESNMEQQGGCESGVISAAQTLHGVPPQIMVMVTITSHVFNISSKLNISAVKFLMNARFFFISKSHKI